MKRAMRAVLLGLGVALCASGAVGSTPSRAEVPVAATAPALPTGVVVDLVSKKDAFLLARRSDSQAPPAPATIRLAAAPRPVVNLYNTWTHEWLTVDARRPAVTADQVARFLRCHFTSARTIMEKRLIPTVVAAAVAFKVTRVDIVSGYRAPKYNLILRKKGRQVARDSQHSHGNAIDFRLPGIKLGDLHAWAVARKLGGVGRYLGSGFVHMDTDAIRYWDGE